MDEYRERLFGYVGDRDPLEVQTATAEALRRLVDGRSEEELGRSPGPAKWCVAQVLAHLADAELVAGFRLRMSVAESGSPLAAYDQDRWAQSMHYDRIPAAASLERFAQMRAWNLALLRSLDGDAWDRYGLHAERGRETLRDHARIYAGHDLNHLMQIRRILNEPLDAGTT